MVAFHHAAYDSHPSPKDRMQLNRSIAKYLICAKMEEDFWRQKAAIRWVADGERNTRFFHGVSEVEAHQVDDSFHPGRRCDH